MNTTTIRTTCTSCQLTFDVPSVSQVLALPAPNDTTAEPSFVHVCPSCLSCDAVTVPWRTAAYLLDAGATTLTAPNAERVTSRYPSSAPRLAAAR